MISKLKIKRMEHSMTQQELSKQLGISERLVSHWETLRKEPTREQCIVLSKILGFSVQEVWPEKFADKRNPVFLKVQRKAGK